VHILLQVIDVGSGRGYLGCHLSLMYHIPVVGIDSSPSNTGSATERTRLLRKHWRGLVSDTMPAGRRGGKLGHAPWAVQGVAFGGVKIWNSEIWLLMTNWCLHCRTIRRDFALHNCTPPT